MIWIRETSYTENKKHPVLDNTPPKKQFQIMLELLIQAERLDNVGEKTISNDILKTLSNYIINQIPVEMSDNVITTIFTPPQPVKLR